MIKQAHLSDERALFKANDLEIHDTVFDVGESPLKEARHIKLYNSLFKYRYPLWYCDDITCRDCTWFEAARAGLWYSNHVDIENAVFDGPKSFRRCDGLRLKNVEMGNGHEAIWACQHVSLSNVNARGDYFGMNSEDMHVEDSSFVGKYAFDGIKNCEFDRCRLLCKDAFWNSENVTVRDSLILGEYLGWNAKNLTLINCTIESLQGMCYIQNLKLLHCKLLNTTLAFEYCTVDADITGHVDSVLNPTSGTIKADSIGRLILQKDRIDPSLTHIVCDDVEETTDVVTW